MPSSCNPFPPKVGAGLSSFLDPLYLPRSQDQTQGQLVGFVEKKDYPDQSFLIATPIHTPHIVTVTLFPHYPELRNKIVGVDSGPSRTLIFWLLEWLLGRP